MAMFWKAAHEAQESSEINENTGEQVVKVGCRYCGFGSEVRIPFDGTRGYLTLDQTEDVIRQLRERLRTRPCAKPLPIDESVDWPTEGQPSTFGEDDRWLKAEKKYRTDA